MELTIGSFPAPNLEAPMDATGTPWWKKTAIRLGPIFLFAVPALCTGLPFLGFGLFELNVNRQMFNTFIFT